MTTYRDLVQRTVACRHADLELGLSRAREQEPFVIHVSELLDKAGIEYAVRMDKDFQTTFCVEFSATAPADVIGILQKYYSVFFDGQKVEAASRNPEGYAVRIVFGDVPV
ncbi:TPA: hypothetical protein ACFM5D_000054 [Neisseria meningitidis]|uniref:Phage protein n=1 Tax=Neisseria meningitidis TaxID=487 RepID=A0A1V0G881_NEIME|nr:hypothetical protein [Neisseria meningitidis]ADY99594.1 hypothetical protein NMBM01240355_1070 [Neisseria meningitidis M01-240355]ARB69707.1 hypothetical protein A6J53_10635 [Neisseria meningitidis]ARB71855.1 hypothetical protein A6J54_09360 [Neisseria meningitidis]ARC10881.1 hypothetical protein A6J50_11940 [Neisseria meningitidis]MBG8597212.1 hypothetical protein [Neisseria meningitidis]